MGKYQRDKGARFEREIANRLKEVFGPRTTRSSGLNAKLAKDPTLKQPLSRQKKPKLEPVQESLLLQSASGTDKSQ